MSSQSIEHTRRQISRARETIKAAIAVAGPKMAGIAGIAPELVVAFDEFERAVTAVNDARTAADREVKEGLAAARPLAEVYDAMREVVGNKVGRRFPAASSFSTPDDLLHAAEEVEHELEVKKAEAWATPLLAAITAPLDAATKEQQEGAAAMKALQSAQLHRDRTEASLRPLFVVFRRTVRSAFGSSSRQYRELLDRRGSLSDDEDLTPELPPEVAPAPTPAAKPGTPGTQAN